MSTKALRTRIIQATPEAMAALARTHRVFNHCVRQMMETYLAMRKGRYGPEAQKLAQILLESSNQQAHSIMEAVTDSAYRGKGGAKWGKLAKELRTARGILFDRSKGFAKVDGKTVRQGRSASPDAASFTVSSKFWRTACADAAAALKSNQELLATWKQERADWLTRRETWRRENAEFVRFFEGPYEDFIRQTDAEREAAQQAAGKPVVQRGKGGRQLGKRFARWHLWHQWIGAHPEILAWRAKATAADFRPITPDALAHINRTTRRQDRRIGAILAWLRKNNPELEAFEATRRTYLRDFRRFARPPTLTLPDPEKHPRWYTFERDAAYWHFDSEAGHVELQVIAEDPGGAWTFARLPLRLKVDPRLRPSVRNSAFAREGILPPYADSAKNFDAKLRPDNPQDRRACVAGAKLILRKGVARLTFTVEEQDCPRRVKLLKVQGRTCTADNVHGPAGDRVPLRILAVDLGIRHIGGFSVSEGKLVDGHWQVTFVKKGIVKADQTPGLFGVRRHDWQLRAARRRTGRAPRGSRSNLALQDHRTDMADDRFKKAAHAIVALARQHNVHAILFEDLERLRPDAVVERWANRQLRDMNRRQVVETVRRMAEEFGFFCDDDLSPYLTSRVCSKCHLPGFRCSIRPKDPRGEKLPRRDCTNFGRPVADPAGHLFRCPHCGYQVQADINAAGNLAHRFFGTWRKDVKLKKNEKGVYQWDGMDGYDAHRAFEEWASHGSSVPF